MVSAVAEASVCKSCGASFQLEGLETLEGVWRESAERTASCPACIEKSEEADRRRVKARKLELYRHGVAAIQLPQVFQGLGWKAMDESEPEDVVEGETIVATQEEASRSRLKAITAAKSWAKGDLLGLVLSGRVGLGKSRLAAVAAQSLVYHRVVDLPPERVETAQVSPLRWVSVPALVKASRAPYESDAREWAERVVAGGAGLVLDDIDKVKPTEFSIDLIFEAIEARESRRRPLLVTTNLRYPELEDLLGEPIASRLAGYCQGHRIHGEDRRGS